MISVFKYTLYQQSAVWEVRTWHAEPGFQFENVRSKYSSYYSLDELEEKSRSDKTPIMLRAGAPKMVSGKAIRDLLNAYYEWFGWPAFGDES